MVILVVAVVVAAVFALILLSVRIDYLPAVALVTFAALPLGYFAFVPEVVGRYFTPSVLILGLTFLRLELGGARSWLARNGTPGFRWIVHLAVLGSVVLAASRTINMHKSAAWSGTVVIALGGSWAVRQRISQQSSRILLNAWLWVGSAIGAMACYEGLTKHSLLGSLYSMSSSSNAGFDQHWSVARATTTLGHPLMNGMFLAVSSAIAFFNVWNRETKRLALVTVILSSTGLLFTVSRSSSLALVAGVGVGLCLMVVSRGTRPTHKAAGVLIAASLVAVVVSSPLLSERSASREGQSSAVYRSQLLHLAETVASADRWLGSGPGTAQERIQRAGATLPMENSYFTTLISLGILGLVVFVIVLVAMICFAWSARRADVVAALVTFAVSSYAWPVWDNNPGVWVVPGLLLILVRVRPTNSGASGSDSSFARDVSLVGAG